MVCWKLVRDGVARELAERGGVRVFRVGGSDLEGLLRLKVVEEALEFAESGSLWEAADLVDVLSEWLLLRGYGWGEVWRRVGAKRASRGGFSGWVVVWLEGGPC